MLVDSLALSAECIMYSPHSASCFIFGLVGKSAVGESAPCSVIVPEEGLYSIVFVFSTEYSLSFPDFVYLA